ncbi:hypothetical protein ACFO25_19580 [Paenactinomyces guangxiensis]|uniref:Uncharacterized protein n=1 Tax=Paenactinomyces guangxiensis TaxID=1490290 RepID=A0A7W1WUY5_9BACL|nr:hypothetical protein [Paenactinomyces guangxiensis]MBA4496525.1 hypothetical protein [Paenactinomyces guangxiensis]MBH8593549.1 hypothetical protein [Paenactinomyces guangxiensis]
MSSLEKLNNLIDQIKDAERKYYNLEYKYNELTNRLSIEKSKLLTQLKLKGKTFEERKAEILPYLESIMKEKTELKHKKNLARVDLNHLKRKYQMLSNNSEQDSYKYEQLKLPLDTSPSQDPILDKK